MRIFLICISAVFTLIASAFIIAKPWITVHHAEPIMVKGYAEKAVSADSGSLNATVTLTGPTRSETYEAAGEALEKVQAQALQILGDGYESVELPSSVHAVAKLNEHGKKTNYVDFFEASRTLRFNTSNVEGLEKLGRALYDLNAEGLSIYINGPSFFVSDLDQIKLELVEDATRNGKERANLMAESSGEKLGPLVSARQGVIQITKKNSTETSSWGVYDTETIDKVVKLVVTVEYQIGG